MAGVPIAVVVKAPGRFQNSRQLHTARAHKINVSGGRGVAIFKRPFLFRLSPEDFIVAVGIEWRVNVDQINTLIWKALELVQAIATIDDLGIEEG